MPLQFYLGNIWKKNINPLFFCVYRTRSGKDSRFAQRRGRREQRVRQHPVLSRGQLRGAWPGTQQGATREGSVKNMIGRVRRSLRLRSCWVRVSTAATTCAYRARPLAKPCQGRATRTRLRSRSVAWKRSRGRYDDPGSVGALDQGDLHTNTPATSATYSRLHGTQRGALSVADRDVGRTQTMWQPAALSCRSARPRQ